ncbi:MAG: hypothetical protein D6720_03075 [Gammaproteobacteria bacterium]|nr:MAG: hypothetical protein D6720_03075 [Gammaproteobacteria bacterium]
MFPKELTRGEREEALRLLASTGADARALLDVLAAAIGAGEIRKSPLAVPSGLVRRHRAGTFDPTPGPHLAEARHRQVEYKARLRQRDEEQARELAPMAPRLPAEGRAAFEEARCLARNWQRP